MQVGDKVDEILMDIPLFSEHNMHKGIQYENIMATVIQTV